jgi:hypothetical protein
MDRTFGIGVAATALGVAGYVAGVFVAYPGRAFSLTAVMLGITCLAVGDPTGDEGGASTGSNRGEGA